MMETLERLNPSRKLRARGFLSLLQEHREGKVVKACRDCRHVRETKNEPACMHPKTANWLTDYYTGKERLVQPSVGSARTIGKCGQDARLFEAREPC